MHRHLLPYLLLVSLSGYPLMAQESDYARVVAGGVELHDTLCYFTRSIEIRLIPEDSETQIFYSLFTDHSQVYHQPYQKQILLSSSARLHFITLEKERKEKTCGTFYFRRIPDIESVTVIIENQASDYPHPLALLDSIQPSPLILPVAAGKVSIILRKGISSLTDSLVLFFHNGQQKQIKRIDLWLSNDGENYIRRKRVLSKQILKTTNDAPSLFCANIETREIKLDIYLKKEKYPRILPLRRIKLKP